MPLPFASLAGGESCPCLTLLVNELAHPYERNFNVLQVLDGVEDREFRQAVGGLASKTSVMSSPMGAASIASQDATKKPSP
jgi:hypothetical protein